MTHMMKFDGEEFEIHSFDFQYSTDHVNGAPAEHGSFAALDIEIQLESVRDSKGDNFKKARKKLWEEALEVVTYNKEKIRKKGSITAKQTASGEGSRTLEFEGWVQSFNETSQGGPQGANSDTLRVRFYVFPKTKQSEPKLT
ncbi:MAG TPA: hypothetical protein RMG48_12255 [Myxococcales bacterium LLY-WYZ-16_1]|jgi:hypothetical protein|nr:hypothetical protein [Myxococcales bacterium LLY-WYZ-16_1]